MPCSFTENSYGVYINKQPAFLWKKAWQVAIKLFHHPSYLLKKHYI